LATQENLIEQISTLVATKAIPPAAEPELQNKTITANGSYAADDGYDGLGTVTVNVSATQSAPTISVSSSGLITASADGKSATKQLTTQSAKTVTPSTSSQTAVASGRYTTGAITVGAIPSDYVKPTTKKAAATYTPSTSNQTIASGTYLTGTQTIKGDTNLKAENIKSGVSIFGINGTASGAEDLETELSQQESLISQLSTILDSKAAGGSGSAQTCTVNLVGHDLGIFELVYKDASGVNQYYSDPMGMGEVEFPTTFTTTVGSWVFLQYAYDLSLSLTNCSELLDIGRVLTDSMTYDCLINIDADNAEIKLTY
jgi:hypothetical protein